MISVTQALKAAGMVDDRWLTAEAARRGSKVHRAIKSNRKQRDIEGYIRAARRFQTECRFDVCYREKEVRNGCLRGHLDACGFIDYAGLIGGRRKVVTRRVIVDYQTGLLGQVHPAKGIQMALYGHLASARHWWLRIGVGLKPNGTYNLRIWPWESYPSDLAVGLAAVRIANGGTRKADWNRVAEWKKRNHVR